MAQDISEYDVANFKNNPDGILAEITGLDPESISGFEGSGVELGIDGSVTKGAITLNANEIPSSITGIEYDQDNQNIILTYEKGAKVSIAQGTLTENNKLTGVTNGDVKYGDIGLNVDNAGTINVNKDGVMKVSGEASANMGSKEFSSGTFQKLGEDTFDTRGKVKFGDTDIGITDASVEITFKEGTTTTSTSTTTTSTDDPSKGKNSAYVTNSPDRVDVDTNLDGDKTQMRINIPEDKELNVYAKNANVNVPTEDAVKKFAVKKLDISEPAAPIANGANTGEPLVENTASEEVAEYRIGRRGRVRRVRINRVGREYVPGHPVVNVAIAVGRVGRGLRGGVGKVGKGVGKGVGKVGKGAAIVAGRAGRRVLRFAGRAGRVVKNIRPGRAVVNIFRRSRERHGPVERLIFKRLRRV